ncbi:hypothetical protein BRAS3843_1090052 [Bradyrhizobium sp. STM 3843]|nr:hypothetical protein BRAS3843_1090052 [Bradyrhizobium sp. STM 3843]
MCESIRPGGRLEGWTARASSFPRQLLPGLCPTWCPSKNRGAGKAECSSAPAGVPVLTFVSWCGSFVYECQNQSDTSKISIF